MSIFMQCPARISLLLSLTLLAACSARVEIRNETDSASRNPSNTYTVQAHVTSVGSVTDLTMTATVLSFGSPPLTTPMTSSDGMNFFATVTTHSCNTVLDVFYEAAYKTSAAATSAVTERGPVAGAYRIPIAGSPGTACGTAAGYSHTFVVNTTVDKVDVNPGNAVCDTGAVRSDGIPECSLRAAVMEANAIAGIDYIEVPAGHYLLTIADPKGSYGEEANSAAGDLDITEGVAIVGEIKTDFLGPGIAEKSWVRPTTIIDAGGDNRIFDIHTVSIGTLDNIVELRRMELTGGRLTQEMHGGAIQNDGYLRLWRVVFNGNAVANDNNSSTVSDGQGGALANYGELEGEELYFYHNTASDGGAIYNLNGRVTIRKSGFYANSARGGGHAIYQTSDLSSMTLENVTLGKNGYYTLPPPASSPIGDGPGSFALINNVGSVSLKFVSVFRNKGGILNETDTAGAPNGSMTIEGSLVGGNDFMNCAGVVTLGVRASWIDANPSYGYGPCQRSIGGAVPTTTFSPPDSVQLAKGLSPVFYTPKNASWRNTLELSLCPTRDQRNISRTPVLSSMPERCEIGAVEYQTDNDSNRIAEAVVVFP